MFDVAGVTALLAVAVLGAWLVTRARRTSNPIVKWLGLALSSLVTVVCVLALVIGLVGFYRINFPPRRAAVADMRVASTADLVARGARFGVICAQCHSPNGEAPLAGRNFFEGGGPPFGTMYAPNLTPAGEIKDWSDGELIRAIREGVHKSGRALIIMPSESFRNLSDADVQAVVAYLRSQPATGSRSPQAKLNVVAAVLLGTGLATTSAQSPITQPILAPSEGTSADYGRYLVSVIGCSTCHGERLAGRKQVGPGPPSGPNLTAIVPKWSREDFVKTLRTGVDPYNHKLLAEMPWQPISSFARDADLEAIYAYLHGLTPIDGPDK